MLQLKLQEILNNSLKEIDHKQCALMFTGGLDSVLLAYLMRRYGIRVTAITVQFEEFNLRTVFSGIKAARHMQLSHQILYVTLKEFLSTFPLLQGVVNKPIWDLDLTLAYAALKKYDITVAGRIFVSGMGSDQWLGNIPFKKDSIDEEAHHQVAATLGYKFIFPFLSPEVKLFSKQIPFEQKQNKKLIRDLIPDNYLRFIENNNPQRREIQIPSYVRQILIRMYGRCCFGDV